MYQVGDEVWLSTRNIKTLRPSRKLDWKQIGRFSIIRIISSYAYELDLPDTMKRCIRYFTYLFFDPVATDPVPGQILPLPSPVEVDDTEELEVAAILDSRRRRGRVEYYIQWIGDGPCHEDNVTTGGTEDILDAFHRSLSNKTPDPNGDLIFAVAELSL